MNPMNHEETPDFSELLNQSTPHAPADPEELRRRLAAGRASGAEELPEDLFAESEPPPWLLGLTAEQEREEQPAVRFEPDDGELDDMLAAARELRGRASAAEFRGTDDGGLVEAAVDGGGTVRELKISERAMGDPPALGRALAAAVTRARAAAEEAQAADVAELFPQVNVDPEAREELLALADRPAHPFTDDLPYEVQNRIAEAYENLRKITETRSRHESTTYTHELDDRLGRISANGARTELSVELRARLPHDLKAAQLAARLVAAFGALDAEIAGALNAGFRGIPLGDTTFGDFLADVERRY